MPCATLITVSARRSRGPRSSGSRAVAAVARSAELVTARPPPPDRLDLTQSLGQPVGRLRPPSVGDVHADVVALLKQPQVRVRSLAGNPGGVLPRNEPVAFAENHDHGLGETPEHAVQGYPGGKLVRLFPACGPAATGECREAVRRTVPDQVAVVVGSAG